MSLPTPDNQACQDFLRQWAPEGPWVLTAISTDRKFIRTQTFRPDDLTSLGKWLEEHNGQRNIYFHVNPPTRDLQKKADREDIARLDWLHVDIDPRAGEDLEEERERALALLRTKLPKGVPPPTCIVFSGGGYQGFWRLCPSLQIDGDLTIAEDVKRYNVQLELLFGADNCHNIDRIMRLPGTVNLPDAKKAKKGRVPTLATLVEFNDNVYAIDSFAKAPLVQTDGGAGIVGGGGSTKIEVPGNVERVQDAAELDEWNVPDRVKIIMAQGRHPDQPKKGDNSRSAWLFDFCCQMVRHGVPDEVIFAVITDPDWGISESVLEFKGSAEKYALRQIAKAKEWAIDPWLRIMNDKYAVIKHFGGKCLVVTEMMDYALGRERLMKMSFTAIRENWCNKPVQIGEDANGNPKFKEVGDWWLKHPQRREYDTIVFAPEVSLPDDVFNLWKGFSVQSIPGDCSMFLDHVRANICAGSEEIYQYVMGWMARAVQKPASAGEVAIVLRGGRGVGKSVFANIFGHLFGRHFMQVSNSSHLVGNFNSHLRDLIVLFADEAFYAGDKKHESTLKTLVTEDTMAIEAKGVDVESAPNYIHLIMASNDIHVIPAGGDERRFLVLDVGQGQQRNSSYFSDLFAQMESGGYEALLHTLMSWDISEYNVRDVPETSALRDQKLLSLGVEEEWWYSKLVEGKLLPDDNEWQTEVRTDLLIDDYVEYTRRFNVSRRGNQVSLGKFLTRACPRLTVTRRDATVEIPMEGGWVREKKQRCRFYQLPSLDDARDRWEELYGREDWEDPRVVEPRLEEEPGSSQETPF